MTYPPRQHPGYPGPQPPPPPPPAPPSRRRGLFLGGLVIGATLAAVAVILVLTGVFPGIGDEPAKIDKTTAAPTDRYAAPGEADPCGQLDLTDFETVLPLTQPASKSDYETNSGAEAAWQCFADFSDGSRGTAELSLIVQIYDTEAEAKKQFTSNDKLGELKWTDSDDITEENPAEGDWNRGVTAFAADDAGQTSQQTVIQDGNLYLDVYFKTRGAARGNSNEAALTKLEQDLIETTLTDLKVTRK